MEITIEGTEKEIADFILGLQKQQKVLGNSSGVTFENCVSPAELKKRLESLHDQVSLTWQ